MNRKRVIHDISLPLSGATPVWPDDPPVKLRRANSLAQGDEVTTSIVTLGTHAGTHLDAPAHFIADGEGVDKIDLETLIGEAWVVDALEADVLNAATLESLPIPRGCERLLLQTRNSRQWQSALPAFNPDYVSFSEDGAGWLVARGVRLVGIDSLSVGPFASGAATHRILLSAGIAVVEGLDLSGVRSGAYQLVCLPLKIVGADGAPARVVLIDRVPVITPP